MCDADISWDDIHQQYNNTLFLYENSPVYCERMGGDREKKEIVLFDLRTQKRKAVPFTFAKIRPLDRRIGFVNSDEHAVYLSRIPARRMQVGISKETLKASPIQTKNGGALDVVIRLSKLRAIEICYSIDNEYPTLQECFDTVYNGHAVSCAFDHQFALTNELQIYYRTKLVGVLILNRTKKVSLDNIVFAQEFSHLISLLKGNYESLGIIGT